MKRFLFLAVLVFSISWSYSVKAAETTDLDTIIKVEGKVMPVDVIKVTSSYVRFRVPGNEELFTIPRKEIHQIKYNNGRIEDYNPLVLKMYDDSAWQAVWITENKADILEMHKRGTVKAHAEPSFRSVKAAKKNATMRIQKKAAAMEGQIIYITKKQSTGGYGEFNGYLIEGVVYGMEPLPEEEEITQK